MKKSLKKVALLCTALAVNISSYAISTAGAVAAGLGAAAGVSLIAYGAHNKHKKRKKRDAQNATVVAYTANSKGAETRAAKVESKHDKKALKEAIKEKKKDLRHHKLSLQKLKRKGNGKSAEASNHRSIIQRIKDDLESLKQRLESL